MSCCSACCRRRRRCRPVGSLGGAVDAPGDSSALHVSEGVLHTKIIPLIVMRHKIIVARLRQVCKLHGRDNDYRMPPPLL